MAKAGNATLAPHEGHVFVDRDASGVFAVTHTLTLERQNLVEGPWRLEMDNEGYGFLISETDDKDDPTLVALEEFLNRQLYLKDDGERVVVDRRAAQGEQQWSLDIKAQRFADSKVTLEYGPMRCKQDFVAFIFVWPRCQSRVFIACQSVYQALGLNTYKQEWSKWAYNGFKRWQKFLDAHGLPDQLVQSQAASKSLLSSDGKLSGNDLPTSAISLGALLALALRWSQMSSRLGGLESGESRASANYIVDSLLKAMSGVGEWRLNVVFVENWEHRWPRPELFGTELNLVVSTEGKVDIKPWKELAASGSCSLASQWWGFLLMGVGDTEEITLKQLFVGGMVNSNFEDTNFFDQLLWRGLRRLELVAMMSYKKGRRSEVFAMPLESDDCPITSGSQSSQDRFLCQYLFAAQEASRGKQTLSLATDKSMVGGLNLHFSMIAYTDNTGAVCPPMVAKLYNSGLASAKDVGDRAAIVKERANIADRQIKWLRKRVAPGAACTWRPQKRHRTGAKNWAVDIDAQVRNTTQFNGLAHFQKPEEIEGGSVWAHWPKWPHISIAADQGSDGVAAVHSLQYWFRCNLTYTPDTSHGCHRDVHVMLKESNLFKYWLVLMISMNLCHGPNADDMRFQQLQESLAEVFETRSYRDCPLFVERGSAICEELLGSADGAPSGARLDEAWKQAASLGLLTKKGYRVNLNRFLGCITGAETLLRQWSSLLFACEHLALEHDMLGGKRFIERALLLQATDGDDGEQAGSTSSSLVTAQDRMLRGCCANALAITVVLLEEKKNFRVASMVVAVCKPLVAWHGHQNRELRDVSRTSEWLQAQISDSKFFVHLDQILEIVTSETQLKACGFLTRLPDERSDLLIGVEDEFASLFGLLGLSLIAARLRRMLWMIGSWPFGLVPLLKGGASAAQAVAQFRIDSEAYDKLLATENRSKTMDAFLGRAIFKQVAVQQFKEAFAETNWQADGRVTELMRSRCEILMQTQIVEDGFNFAKNHRTIKGKKKFRRPQKSFCVVLEKKVMSKQHRFLEVKADIPLGQKKKIALSKDNFVANGRSTTLPLRQIESTKATPQWWSPPATNYTLPAADLALLRHCAAQDSFNDLDSAFLGAIFSAKHQLCFKTKCPQRKTEQWFLSLYHFPGSSVLAWPITLVERKGPGSKYIEVVFDTGLSSAVVIAILNIEGMQGSCYQWRSWAWQLANISTSCKSLKPGLRCFRSGPVDLVERLAARAAFWELDVAFVQRFCSHRGFAMEPGLSLYRSLIFAVGKILECGETAASECVHRRLAKMRVNDDLGAEIMQCDEAVQVLDRNDEKEFKAEQDKVRERRAEAKAFKKELREHKRELRQKAGVGAGRGRGSRRGRGSGQAARRALPDLSTIAHSSIKDLVPPGGFVWKHNTQGQWIGRLTPYSAVSRSWSRWTEAGALKLVLQHIWRQYMEKEGMDESEIPITGLFD